MEMKPHQTILHDEMKNFIILLPQSNIDVFMQMYSHDDLNRNIGDVIENLPESKIQHAYQQILNTLQKFDYYGWQHRHENSLPNESCQIEIIKIFDNKTETFNCDWIPYNGDYSTNDEDDLPGEGYLGTAYTINEPKIGFHAWKQNNSEFLWYKIISQQFKTD